MYYGSFVNVTKNLSDIHKGYAEKDSPRISKAIVFLMVVAFTATDLITIRYFMLSLFNEKDQTASMLAFVLALILDACPSIAGLLLSRHTLRSDKKATMLRIVMLLAAPARMAPPPTKWQRRSIMRQQTWMLKAITARRRFWPCWAALWAALR